MADLYKLLVYDPGSFFVNHRDTEKAAGMFATLIIAAFHLCRRTLWYAIATRRRGLT